MFYQIDYSSVRRVPNVKLTGQIQGTTINTMPTSASLQDISSHAQKFTWNNTNTNANTTTNNDNQEQRLVHFPQKLIRTNPTRQLTTSQSDERIFEHPEVTIIPSALDDELQRRLLTMKSSITNENLLERDAGQNISNILEHPDMSAPVVMQSQQMSSSYSSSGFLIQNDFRRVSRTQSADVYTTTVRTPSPDSRVEFFIDDQQNSRRSFSPGSFIGNIIERPEQENHDDLQKSTTESIDEYSKSSSKSNNNNNTTLNTKKNDSW